MDTLVESCIWVNFIDVTTSPNPTFDSFVRESDRESVSEKGGKKHMSGLLLDHLVFRPLECEEKVTTNTWAMKKDLDV